MQILTFDGRMGASGDMFLGTLIGAGADPSVLDPVEKALDLEYTIGNTTRCGIRATDVQVVHTGIKEETDDETAEHGVERSGVHSHAHADHDQDHSHSHSHDGHTQVEGAGPHRSYGDVIDIVESLPLSASVEDDALAIFRRLGEAEAAVHGMDLTEIHFHEVGADDAIADIVGAALLVADLNPDRVVTTPVATGNGEVEMSHGVYPIPAPAVVELTADADWQLRGGPVEAELLTPTGAAILTQFADGVDRLPTLDIDAVGYGAGTNSFDVHPNVLRAIRGETTEGLTRDPVTVLETNVDDVTAETLGALQETLADAGALDVSILPTTMKKSRPGHLVKVIVKPEHAEQVARRLAIETGTLGVREHGRGHRLIADRENRTVTVELAGDCFDIGVKIARIGEEVFDVSVEFDDAKAVADQVDLPIREIMRRGESLAYDTFGIHH